MFHHTFEGATTIKAVLRSSRMVTENWEDSMALINVNGLSVRFLKVFPHTVKSEKHESATLQCAMVFMQKN